MGSSQSTERRGVQTSLPYPFPYSRLSPSSDSPEQRLLDHDDQNWEQLNLEYETNWEKNTALENEIVDIRSKISRLESMPHSKMVKQNKEIEANRSKNVALEKEIVELWSKLSDLQLHSLSEASARLEAETRLQRKVDDLQHKIAKLQVNSPSPNDSSMKKQETAIENLKQNYAALENEIAVLKTTIDQLKATTTSVDMKEHTLDSETAMIRAEAGIPPGPEMKDLLGCLMVLIFLVSFLIGINL